MKNSIPFFTIGAGFALLLTSCVVQTPLHGDTSKITYASPKLDYPDFAKGKLTVLPIVTEDNSNIQLKEEAGEALDLSLRNNFPGKAIISSAASASLINDAGLSSEYAHLLDDSKISGILNKATLNKLSVATGSRYFLYTEVQVNAYPQRRVDHHGHLYVPNPDAKEYAYNCQLWDAQNAALVWKGQGAESRSVKDTVITSDEMLLPCAADNLARRLARNVKDVSDGKDATSIIDEIDLQQQKNGTIGGVIIVLSEYRIPATQYYTLTSFCSPICWRHIA